MILQNPIGWCDDTTNAVTGCDKISPGCKNCYAADGTRARVLRSQGIETWGPAGARHPVAEFNKKLQRLNKLCICNKCHETFPFESMMGLKTMWHEACDTGNGDSYLRRIRLFADSNSDWLDPKWSANTMAVFVEALYDCPNLNIQLLTKRPELFHTRLEGLGSLPNNVWIGVSVENNDYRSRIGILKYTPAAVKFISFEPLLEKLGMLELTGIDWAIIGGESGRNRRDCGVDAIVDCAKQCIDLGVKTYVKQDSSLLPGQQGLIPDHIWSCKEFPDHQVLPNRKPLTVH